MAKSMTGYGRSDFSINGGSFSIEVKSLNHRFMDISLRCPERFYQLEARIREEIKKRFSRGSFSVFITATSAEAPALKLNTAAAKAYLDAAAELKETLGVGGEIDVGFLLKMKEILYPERKAADDALVGRVESRAPEAVKAYRQRLTEEMGKLLKERLDDSRILLEAAVFAERSDIREEITRLRSHINMFEKYLDAGGHMGKKLDFLCQEMGREVNTIGSKAGDVGITHTVVEMKGEVEKIREQVQNIE
ncbi:MAG: YicC family protein [Deltaproteobacteria bacterium]|nr:YicC family protein [Deltaproteobacteria bacterium]